MFAAKPRWSSSNQAIIDEKKHLMSRDYCNRISFRTVCDRFQFGEPIVGDLAGFIACSFSTMRI